MFILLCLWGTLRTSVTRTHLSTPDDLSQHNVIRTSVHICQQTILHTITSSLLLSPQRSDMVKSSGEILTVIPCRRAWLDFHQQFTITYLQVIYHLHCKMFSQMMLGSIFILTVKQLNSLWIEFESHSQRFDFSSSLHEKPKRCE